MTSPGPLKQSPSGGLRLGRRLNLGMAMAEQHRPPAAHEIDIFASVDVAHPAAFGGGEELRIAFRKPRGVQMAPHAAGNDPLRPVPATLASAVCVSLNSRRLFGHGVLSFVAGRRRASALTECAGVMLHQTIAREQRQDKSGKRLSDSSQGYAEQTDELRLPLHAGFLKYRFQMSSDRIVGNAGRGRNLFDGFSFGDLAGGPCFGRRQIEQRLQQ